MNQMIRLAILSALLPSSLDALSAADSSPVPARHLTEVAPRFSEPSDDPAWVMPVGSGDLSAMLRYDDAWEIHLSKTDFFGFDKSNYHKNPTILSPGHVQLSFGIPRDAIRFFEQRLDYLCGLVALEIKTDDGTVKAAVLSGLKSSSHDPLFHSGGCLHLPFITRHTRRHCRRVDRQWSAVFVIRPMLAKNPPPPPIILDPTALPALPAP